MTNKPKMSDVSGFPDELLNGALLMSLEWGESWGKPLPPRLQARYTHLTGADADALSAWCDEVKNFAFALIEKEYPETMANRPGTARAQIKTRYPQVDDDNLSRLHNQGMYYAWHG